MSITPRSIHWRGPHGHVVELDEGGVTLVPGDVLVPAELDQLLDVIAEAKRVAATGLSPAPQTAPTTTR